jgi:hypothetical protein
VQRNAALKFTSEQEAFLTPLYKENSKITPVVLCEKMDYAEHFKNRKECLLYEVECKKFLLRLFRDEKKTKGTKQCMYHRSVHAVYTTLTVALSILPRQPQSLNWYLIGYSCATRGNSLAGKTTTAANDGEGEKGKGKKAATAEKGKGTKAAAAAEGKGKSKSKKAVDPVKGKAVAAEKGKGKKAVLAAKKVAPKAAPAAKGAQAKKTTATKRTKK